jgi:uncharacterized Zn-binding protein involved in type VI secretion
MSRPRVTVEGKLAVTQNSNHKAVAPLDVCLTPVGPNLAPMPYVNMAPSSHLKGGSATVRIGGARVMLAGSQLRPSTGNEAGVGGGIKSKVTRGPAEPVQTSLWVRIEGAHVVRQGDVVFQNGKNTLGTMQ